MAQVLAISRVQPPVWGRLTTARHSSGSVSMNLAVFLWCCCVLVCGLGMEIELRTSTRMPVLTMPAKTLKILIAPLFGLRGHPPTSPTACYCILQRHKPRARVQHYWRGGHGVEKRSSRAMPLNLKITWGEGASSARLLGLDDATTLGDLKALVNTKTGIDTGM